MTHAPSSYDGTADFGLLYDAVPAYGTRGDVPFYVEEARRAAGPVLELGCGTGRILLELARAGRHVVGIDGSAQMLDRCRAKLAAEPAEVRARVTLHQSDVRDFVLGDRFALVIAPFRILQHLLTLDDQQRCLDAVSRHLGAGGRFVFDVFNPRFSALVADRSAEQLDTAPLVLPDGRVFWRTVRIPRVRWIEQISETELIYHLADGSAAPRRHVQAFDMRWYLHAELTHLLARAGFRVDATFGDFDRSPLVDASPEQIVLASS